MSTPWHELNLPGWNHDYLLKLLSQTSSWSIGPSTHKVSAAIAATICWHVMFGKREDGQYRAQVDRKNEKGVERLLGWHREIEGADEEMIWWVR
jgi:hypothetical protein